MTEERHEPAKPRRHLPVIGAAAKPTEDATNELPPEERPGWQWSMLTGVGMLLGWLLLASVANAALVATSAGAPSVWAAVLTNVGALLVSAFGAGALAGRFGLKATAKQIATGSAGTAAFGWVLAWARPDRAGTTLDWALTLVVMIALAVAGALVGVRATRGRAV
jgi:hypothetical protein